VIIGKKLNAFFFSNYFLTLFERLIQKKNEKLYDRMRRRESESWEENLK